MAQKAETMSSSEGEVSLKDKGNEFFKAGNYLKAAALYTQAIKKDPSNATLYRFNSLLYSLVGVSFLKLHFVRLVLASESLKLLSTVRACHLPGLVYLNKYHYHF